MTIYFYACVLHFVVFFSNTLAFYSIVAIMRCKAKGTSVTSCRVPNVNEYDLINLEVDLKCQKPPNGCNNETNFKLNVRDSKVFLDVSNDCNGLFTIKKAECGIGDVPSNGFRIYDGHEATSCRQFPWMVFKPGCGASIINKNHILIAAHCILEHMRDYPLVTPLPPSKIQLYAGTTTRNTGNLLEVEKYFIHEDYNKKTFPYLFADIAVIRLKRGIQFSDCQRPICLQTPVQHFEQTQKNCRVSGWGYRRGKSVSSLFPSNLSWAPMEITDENICREDHYNVYTADNLCAGASDSSNAGICGGDSGGPLVCKLGNRWYQYGVVSGVTNGCGTSSDLYSNVSYYYSWIQSKINSP